MAVLYNIEAIDLSVSGADSGTISGAQSVAFVMDSGTGTVLTNQTLDAAGLKVLNFDALPNGEAYYDIPYTVDAASTMRIIGNKYVEVT